MRRPILVGLVSSCLKRLACVISSAMDAKIQRDIDRYLDKHDKATRSHAAVELMTDHANRHLVEPKIMSVEGLGLATPGVNGVFVLTILGRMRRDGLMPEDMADRIETAIGKIAELRTMRDRSGIGHTELAYVIAPFNRVSLSSKSDWRFALDYLRAYAFSQGKLAELNRIEAEALGRVTSHEADA